MKNILLLFILMSLFSCSKEADSLSSFDKDEPEIGLRKNIKKCNPNINFPLSFSSIANPGQEIIPWNCNPENFTTSGSSALEAFYDCKYDNLEELTPPVTCENIVVSLYDYCNQPDTANSQIKLFPSANPISSDPYYIEATGANLSDNDVFTAAHFNTITEYANSIVFDLANSNSYDYLDVEFFTTPVNCLLGCSCDTISDENNVETLEHPTAGITLYMEITFCKLKDGPILTDVLGG